MRRSFAVIGLAMVGMAWWPAPGAWAATDVSGRWSGFTGDLTVTQNGGSLTGTFQMKTGCTELYKVSGSIAGAAVSLDLRRAAGPVDEMPCAATQTMRGAVDASGTSMSLNLANFMSTSPATRFVRSGPVPTTQRTSTTVAGRPTTTVKPATAKPTTTTIPPLKPKSYTVGATCVGKRQLCTPPSTFSFTSPKGTVTLTYTAATSHCSDVRVILAVDGGAGRTTPFVRPGGRVPGQSFAVGAGTHKVTVTAEGRPGGCNTGWVARWGGTVEVRPG